MCMPLFNKYGHCNTIYELRSKDLPFHLSGASGAVYEEIRSSIMIQLVAFAWSYCQNNAVKRSLTTLVKKLF